MNLTTAQRLHRLATRLGLATATAVLLSCGRSGPEPAPPVPASAPPVSGGPVNSASALANQVAAATQAYRTSQGKALLTRHAGLDALATQHAQYMARTGQAGHHGWADRSKTARTQHGFNTANENVMRGNLPDRTQWTPITMNFWKTSKAHNRNLLDSGSTHYGVGAVLGPDGFFNVVYISGGT